MEREMERWRDGEMERWREKGVYLKAETPNFDVSYARIASAKREALRIKCSKPSASNPGRNAGMSRNWLHWDSHGCRCFVVGLGLTMSVLIAPAMKASTSVKVTAVKR